MPITTTGAGNVAGGASPPPPPAPVADFTGTPLSGTDPLSVTFTDLSTGTPTGWSWERNSGSGWTSFSTAQNPTQSFTVATWDVRLTAANGGGSNTKTRLTYISVTGGGGFSPSLDFSDARNSMYL